jgi:hypothetical protein
MHTYTVVEIAYSWGRLVFSYHTNYEISTPEYVCLFDGV